MGPSLHGVSVYLMCALYLDFLFNVACRLIQKSNLYKTLTSISDSPYLFKLCDHHLLNLFEFQDENRYNAGRGAHINLKRAEKARVTVSKIPGIYSP